MSKYKLNFGDVKAEVSFFDSLGADRYFCQCGGFLKKEQIEGANDKKDSEIYKEDIEMTEIIESFKIHGYQGVPRCAKCGNNFSHAHTSKKLVNTETFFVSGYVVEQDETFLKLYHSKVKAVAIPRLNSKDDQDMEVVFIEELKYISLNKETKELFYKNALSREKEFDLDQVVDILEDFFTSDTQVVLNLFDLHMFVDNLAKYVSDSSNINIVTELLSKLRGRHNSAGVDVFKVILSIFFGIIKYSNLSTIALVKNTTFLYDLMKECKIPKPDILREQHVTSPLEIFNFLTANYVKLLNEEVNADNKKVHSFVYKGKKLKDLGENLENIDKLELEGEESELAIVVNDNSNYKEGRVKKTETGYQVVDAASDRKVSKYLFKSIRNFSDYQKLIKYLKFLSYDDLMDLIIKNDINLLINTIDLVYFRDNLNYEELKRLIYIFVDFAKTKTYHFKPTLEEQEIDYSYLKDFSFTDYDDTLQMITALKFDPRKEFYKIKTYNHLKSFHDSVVKYYNAMSDAEKNGEFRDFVAQFRYLEERTVYDGPLTIKLLSSPVLVIKEGAEMNSCAGSYVRRIMNGQYILLQIFDNTDGLPKGEVTRFTFGLFYDATSGLEFDQVKGSCNVQGSNRFKKEVMKYLEAMDISYRPLRDLKLNA